MSNPLTTKLRSFADLSAEEANALDEVCQDTFTVKGRDLIQIGDRPEQVFLVLDGWACRYKDLPDGKRQILAYLIPGDLCDPHIFILEEMDHSIRAIGEARVAAIPKRTILDLTERYPALARAFWWSALVDEAVSREWLVNIAQRDSHARMAHLFCEMWLRMCQVKLTQGGVRPATDAGAAGEYARYHAGPCQPGAATATGGGADHHPRPADDDPRCRRAEGRGGVRPALPAPRCADGGVTGRPFGRPAFAQPKTLVASSAIRLP